MNPALDQSAPLPLAVVLAGVAGAIGITGALAWWVMRRRAASTVQARLARAADDLLAGVLVPNVDAGQIHLEFAALTRRGIVVVDVRDVAGHVFGSETMQDWTVLSRNRRFTFANPLPALYDRVAAVRRLLPDLPVRGVVAFTARAEFTKGFPPNVALLEALLAELIADREATDGPPAEQLQAAWAALRREATPSRS